MLRLSGTNARLSFLLTDCYRLHDVLNIGWSRWVSRREDALEAEAIQLIQDQAAKAAGVMVHTPPAGALCCDRLLFGPQMRRARVRQPNQQGQPGREMLLAKA